MSDPFRESLNAIFDHLIEAAKNDSEIRNRLRHVAEEILLRTSDPQTLPVPPDAEAAAETLSSVGMIAAMDVNHAANPIGHLDRNECDRPEDVNGNQGSSIAPALQNRPKTEDLLKMLTLGKSAPSPRPLITLPKKYNESLNLDLEKIQSRCRLKADAARWASKRQKLIDQGADFASEIAPGDREIKRRASKTEDCYLWMCDPYKPVEKMIDRLETVAGCFDALAAAIELVIRISRDKMPSKKDLKNSMSLMAEAKCALKTISRELGLKDDLEETQAHNWLAMTGRNENIFLNRFMEKSASANPDAWPDLLHRIESVSIPQRTVVKKADPFKKALDRIRFKLKQAGTGTLDWSNLASEFENLITAGLPASNTELREILLPHIDHIPEDLEITPNFALVLREIDRYLSNQVDPEPDRTAEATREVLEASKLLKGKTLLMIGGDFRPASHQALKEAFELAELIWFSVREHESISIFEPSIIRPDVAAVLLAIRWSSHSYGEIKDLCDSFHKPLIRLPGGYNPNQVAVQVLNQASHRLAESGTQTTKSDGIALTNSTQNPA